jgi:error-prone DNA polymerase
MALGETIMADYASLRLTLRAHPLALLRPGIAADGIVPCARLGEIASGTRARVAGLVLVRQRPGSASGVIFATIEDETGVANVIIWPGVFERYRRIVLGARLLAVAGEVQREGIVTHLIAERLADWTDRLAALADADAPAEMAEIGDAALARADEVRRPGKDPPHPTPSAADFPSRDFH